MPPEFKLALMLCLGIDSGTASCKVLVLDVDAGKVLAQTSAPHSFVENLPPGHVEQNPQTWIDAAERAIAECLNQIGERRKEIVAIGVGAQQHGLVVLDQKNVPIRPAKLWCDVSSAEQAEKLNRAFGNTERLIEQTGNAMVAGYTAAKILWLKENEPENFAHTRSILLPHDFLNFWLTGERQMEHGDASGTGLLDVRNRIWCQPLMEFIDDDLLEKFPPLRTSTRPAGLLRASLGEKFGIGDALVSAGGGDNMLAAVGTGNIALGNLTLSLGSSGAIYGYSETPVIDPRGEISAFCDSTDHWLPLACTMNVASVIRQFCVLLDSDAREFEKNASEAKPGGNGLTFLPYLQGERLPNLPRASGVLHGMNLQNTNRRDLARAVSEGIVVGLARGLKRLRDLGINADEIRLTGGGSKGALARQLVADVFELPVISFKNSEGAALGVAIQAGWTFCQTKGNPVPLAKMVKRAVKSERKLRAEPRKENAQFYADLRGRHADLSRKLAANGYL